MSRRHCQIGSLAGAARLANDNVGELNENGNLMWNKKVKAHFLLIFSMNTNCESMSYQSLSLYESYARGVRKVTTATSSSFPIRFPPPP